MRESIDTALKQFIEAAHRAYESGIQTGTGGNISVRLVNHNLMVVKPSGFSFGQCSKENIVVTDFTGEVVEGKYKPTRELVLHCALYKEFAAIGGVVHTHSPYTIAWSLTNKEVPLITKHTQLKMKNPIPVLPIDTPDVTTDSIPMIYKLIREQDLSAFVLQGHGIVAFAKTVLQAEQTVELIEETAKIAWLHAIGTKLAVLK
jgi:L-ribulose-5-phosphate 4-epimerase